MSEENNWGVVDPETHRRLREGAERFQTENPNLSAGVSQVIREQQVTDMERMANDVIRAGHEMQEEARHNAQMEIAVQHWINWYISEKPCLPMHDYTQPRLRRDFSSFLEAITLMLHDIENETTTRDNENLMILLNQEHFIQLRHDADQMNGIEHSVGIPSTTTIHGIKVVFNVHVPISYIIVVNRSSLHPRNAMICLENQRNGLIRINNMRGYRPRQSSTGDIDSAGIRSSNVEFLEGMRSRGELARNTWVRRESLTVAEIREADMIRELDAVQFRERVGLEARRP